MTQNLIETVFAKIRAEYPHYPATKPVTKSTMLATLKATSDFIASTTNADDVFALASIAWIDDVRAEIESAE